MGSHQIWAWPVCVGCSTWQSSAAKAKVLVLFLPESGYSFEPSLLLPNYILQQLNPDVCLHLCPHPSVIQLPVDRSSRERHQVMGKDFSLNLSDVPWRVLQQLVSGSVASLSLVVGKSLVTASSFVFWSWVEPQLDNLLLHVEREDISWKFQIYCHRCAWNSLSLLVTVVPTHGTSAGLLFTCLHELSQCLLVPCTKAGMTSAWRNSTRQWDV